jgi:hypothetical protein
MNELVLYRKGKDNTFYPAWKFPLDEINERLELDGVVIAGGKAPPPPPPEKKIPWHSR